MQCARGESVCTLVTMWLVHFQIKEIMKANQKITSDVDPNFYLKSVTVKLKFVGNSVVTFVLSCSIRSNRISNCTLC